MQNGLLRHIAEVHVEHGDVALQFGVGGGIVRLVVMLPCPVAGALGSLGDVAVLVDLCVDQMDIALILFRLLVHQLEDPLRAGQSHDDGVDLLGDLVDGLVEGTGQSQEGDQLAHGQQRTAGADSQQAADDGENSVLDVAQIVVHRAHNVGVSAGLEGVFPQLVVQFIELLLAGFLVGEDLDHALAVDHFLHEAVDRAQGALLADEELGGLAGQSLGDPDDAADRGQQHQRQDGGRDQHGDEHHHQRGDGGNALGDGLGDHLAQGVDVAGVAAHNVACGMGVEIADGQGLHVGEHFIPDGLLGALTHLDHQEVVQEGRNHAHQVDAGHHAQELDQRGIVGIALGQHGGDVAVHQRTQGGGADSLSNGAEDDAHDDDDHGHLVFCHIGKQAGNGLLGVLGHTAVTAHFYRRHYSSPPFV